MTRGTTAPPYRAARVDAAPRLTPPEPRRGRATRTVMRSLTHHAKEALVAGDGGDPAWRLFSDEGDYFGGTDLAPPPLGLFGAGLAASYAGGLRALAARRGSSTDGLRVTEDSLYTTEGSALRGTIQGGALPVEVRVDGPDDLRALAEEAIAASPVHGLLRRALTARFALYLNGERISTGDEAPEIDGPALDDPALLFDQAVDGAGGAEPLVVKVEDDADPEQPPGDDEAPRDDGQARRPHARAVCAPRDDGLLVIDEHLFQPPGSHFRMLADEDGSRAPAALSYVSAGLAFCYATQVIRYAQLTKLRLDGCRLVQDLWLGPGDDVEPPETHLYLDTTENADAARRIMAMGGACAFCTLCAAPRWTSTSAPDEHPRPVGQLAGLRVTTVERVHARQTRTYGSSPSATTRTSTVTCRSLMPPEAMTSTAAALACATAAARPIDGQDVTAR